MPLWVARYPFLRESLVAAPRPSRLGLPGESSGTWETLADGSRLWRLRIAAPGARSLNLGLALFDPPAGARLWWHDGRGEIVHGPYTSADRNAAGGLWTPLVPGDEAVLELQLPAGAERTGLEVSSVNRGYRDLVGDGAKQGACNIDVICPEGDPWRDQIRSVARFTISGSSLCTGQLVNTTAGNATPYFLTAQHCVTSASQAPTVVLYWNYQSSTCGALSGGSLAQSQSGATLVASSPFSTGSDFSLLLLDEPPAPEFGVYYAGWDAREPAPANGVVGLHHPAGDEKAISLDDDPLTVTSYLSTASPGNGLYLRVGAWERGTTEGGSSGSCIFDAVSKRCVGTLSGGFASCFATNESDWYGRLARQFSQGATAEERLRDWLDPLGTGALAVDGMNPPSTPIGSTRWLVPAAASTPGTGGSDWRSQVVVVNPTDGPVTVRVHFVAAGVVWPGEPLTGPVTLESRRVLVLDDPLVARRPAQGLLWVEANRPGMVVSSRTFNLKGDGSTFGQGIPGLALVGAGAPARLVLPLAASAPGRFRSNLGIVHTSTTPILVTVRIYRADGVLLASRSYSPSAAYTQVNDVFGSLGVGSLVISGGWLAVDLTGGSPDFWTAYLSIVDVDTGDPTYVAGVARE